MVVNPYQQYQKTSVTTANKVKILLMLYEGAIKFVKQAQINMQKKEVAKKGVLISKATAILSELMNTLDFEAGGQLAVDLENLYIFMIDHLIEANINNDVDKLKDVERILKTLYAGWVEIADKPNVKKGSTKSLDPDGVKDQNTDKAKNMDNDDKQSEDERSKRVVTGVDFNV